MPGGLVDEVLRALGLERETEEAWQRRTHRGSSLRISEQIVHNSRERKADDEAESESSTESEGEDVAGVPEQKGQG